MGYINASWTLKVDIVSDYIARLLGYMDQHALETVFAQGDVSAFQNDTIMGDLSAGYIARAVDIMPKQGKYAPWQITHNYLADRKALKHANFNDQVLQFNKI